MVTENFSRVLKKVRNLILWVVAGLAVVVVILAVISLASRSLNFSSYHQPLLTDNDASYGSGGYELVYDESAGLTEANPGSIISGVAPKAEYAKDTAGDDTVLPGVDLAYAEEGEYTQKKIIRDGNLSLFVESPEESVVGIQQVATAAGGFVQFSRVYEQTNGLKTGSIVIRVAADKFEEVFNQVKSLAKEVEDERVEAKDVTEQFIDLEAQLRNYQAEETRYLEFMSRAKNMDETLKIAERLTRVRSEIEMIQGKLQYLARQVDMSTISVELTSYDDVKVFGIRWRPLYEVKKAFRGMLEKLSGYANFMINLILYLPVIILWAVTVGVVLLAVWKLSRWFYRKFLRGKKLIKD